MKTKHFLSAASKLTGLASLFAVMMLFTSSAFAQIAGSTINGMVFGSEKRALTDINVELLDEYSRLVQTTKTQSGRFTFRGLVAGVYRIRVLPQRFGYAEQVQEIQIINISRSSQVGATNDSVYVDFYLQPFKAPSMAESMGIISTVFAQDVPSEAEKLYEQALQDFEKNKTSEGIANLKKAIEAFPKYYLALNRLAEEAIKKEEYLVAEIILNQAVAVNNKGADAYFLLGYSQYVSKKYGPAIKSLEQAVTWSPKSAQAYLLLGMSFKQIMKFSDAETQMLKAKDLSKKKLPDVHWQLALLYGNNLKKYSEAANELELFLKYQSDLKDTENIKRLIKDFRDKAAQAVK
jgi:tetratricopeptide (TPR) repeat protein